MANNNHCVRGRESCSPDFAGFRRVGPSTPRRRGTVLLFFGGGLVQRCCRPKCHTAGTDMDAGLPAVLEQEEAGSSLDLLPQVKCSRSARRTLLRVHMITY